MLELAPVLVRDMESRIVLWTKGAERLYGYSKAEAVGRVSHELFQTEFAEGKEYVDEMLRGVGQWEGELEQRKRNGERLVVASQQIVYRDSRERPVHILEVNTDITGRIFQESLTNVALFDSSATSKVAPIHAYLSCVTQRAGIEFLSAARPASLFPVVRTKGEAIWPGSVERTLLSLVKVADR